MLTSKAAGATGTVDWMSPELLSEALHVPDRATDQWALGKLQFAGSIVRHIAKAI